MKDLGITRISPSMLMEYESCPKLFYYRSWLGLQLPQPQRHLKFGSAIHLAIDNIYEQFDEKDKWKLADKTIPKKIFKKNWTVSCIGDDEFKTLQERTDCFDEMLEDGLEIIDQFWDRKEEIYSTGFEPVKFEIPIKRVLKNLKTGKLFEIPHSMRLDSEAKRDRIGEFKTSAKEYDPTETKNSLQSLSYAYEKFDRTNTIPWVDYIVMVKKRKKNKIQHFTIVYTESDLLSYCERVDTILDRIRNREFEPPPRGHPPWCDCKKFVELLKIE